VVLVTNFMCQHSVWLHSLDRIEQLLRVHAEQHAALAVRLKQRYNLEYRRIFMSGVAIHGFRGGGITPGRQRLFNEKAVRILGQSGWEILDAYNRTLDRVDGTVDGVHYRGGVSIALTDILVNMLCNRNCSSNVAVATAVKS
jgi:hypothetical protein